MKKKMLLALGYCLALSFSPKAQIQTNLSDTVAITPLPGSRILFIGKDMKKLVEENNFEILKNGFINDMKESAKDKDFPSEPKEAIYLVAADGRRRLKAKTEELIPFDTDKEIQQFSANLPPVHYIIYDLQKAIEYHIYLKDFQQLYLLEKINFATVQMAIEKKAEAPGRYVRFDVEADNGEWSVTPALPGNRMLLELSTSFNVSLFNSTLSPGLAVHADFITLSKHRVPRYKLGTSFTSFALGEYSNYQFTNIHGGVSIDLRLMRNISPQTARPMWLGFLFGRTGSGKVADSLPEPSLNRRFKFGFSSESGFLGVDYAFIPPRGNESSMQNITFRFRF